jgi:hypothetical protein
MANIKGVDAAMAVIHGKAEANLIDYQFVMWCLKDYASPRAKLGRLIHDEALIRLKKGLYLLGPQFLHHPYCLELLANLIHGPSYVSLERALYIYGMIPEHVEAITSVTAKSSCNFRTPVGNFIYAHCHPKSYSIGVTTRNYAENENPFIATREKALTDMLTIRRGKITSQKELESILLEDLRIEEEDLLQLDLDLIQEIYQVHPHSAVHFLKNWLTEFKAKQ